ncbi:MAG: zinc ribbon domain-containing protein [Methanobrevibacter sp.]|nr:zinc ribbon domain-containing protein [Methanobrevibacter sp.]
MNKSCSNCGYINNENAKFCLNCGNSLESDIVQEDNFCRKCGSRNLAGSNFCEFCGSPLATGETSNMAMNNHTQENFDSSTQAVSSNEINCPYCGNIIFATDEKCKYCGEWVKRRTSPVHNQPEKTHTLAIVLGYIFSFLGGLLGVVIAIYLLTRNNKDAKTHGIIMIFLNIIMTIVWLMIAFSTGIW